VAITVDHESKHLSSKSPPISVLLLLLQLAGGLKVDPMIFAPLALASGMNGPVRLPSVFMPTRRMDKPIASVPAVPNSLSTGKLLLLGIQAVVMPKPWMVWCIASSLTVTPLGVLPSEPLMPAPPESPELAPPKPLLAPEPDELPPEPFPFELPPEPFPFELPPELLPFELPEVLPLEPFALAPPGPLVLAPPKLDRVPPLPRFGVVAEEQAKLVNAKM